MYLLKLQVQMVLLIIECIVLSFSLVSLFKIVRPKLQLNECEVNTMNCVYFIKRG